MSATTTRSRFWAKIFGLNFAVGVVTGIPMEFQFGTNWSNFSRYSGGVIGQTLAMEGMFAFLLESAFVGALVFGEKRLGPRKHFLAAVAVAVGSWLSGYFILVTNAFMQHPVGYVVAADGTLGIGDLRAYLLNPWALVQFAHNQAAALVTGTFAVTAVGALYALRESHRDQARLYLRHGTVAGLAAAVLVAFPTGDRQAKMVARYQEPVLAAMEGRFETGPRAEITIIGQPNVKARRLDNPIKIPGMLSFLAYGTFHSDVRGLDAFPQETWPDNIELLYYAFHVMAGLGTIFIGLMGLANVQRLRGRLEVSRALLWALMLAFPFPFIANTAGWMTTELGRQPWLIYGLFRTRDGYSDIVSSGDVLFTLIGLTGLYFVLGLLYLYLVGREILHGPDPGGSVPPPPLDREPVIAGGHMVEVWFVLLCVTLVVFAVLDGWNIGAGALHLIAGKTASERREIIAAIGPHWSWHEVWLLAAGGTFLLAFPSVMATSFAGFYLALWFVLWSFILRGVSIEVGGHLQDRLWQSWWDFVFAVSSVLLAVLFGAALGNVIRGVPLDGSGKFSMSLFTDFGVRGRVGILDWYTLSVAVFTTVLLSAHGATYLRLKTTGLVHERGERLARWLWAGVLVLFPVISLETWIVRPALYQAMIERPAAWLAVAVVLAGAWALITGLRGTERASRLCRIMRGDRRPPGGRSGQCVSHDAALDPRARAFDDRLHWRCPGARARPGLDLVADRVRARGHVFHGDHAEFPRQGKAGGGHAGVLLNPCAGVACTAVTCQAYTRSATYTRVPALTSGPSGPS